MYLDSFSSPNCGPFLTEFLHHFFPDEERLIRKLVNAFLCLLLELEQSETSLDRSRFLHQEFQISVGYPRLVRSPVFLQYNSCVDGTFLSFEFESGDSDARGHFVLIGDAFIQFFF